MNARSDFFKPLPHDFDHLAHAVRQRRGSGLGPELDLRSVGERTYSAFEAVSFSPQPPANAAYAPRQRDWRHLPYALWLQADRGLHLHPELTQHYAHTVLPQALAARRPLKWARALLHTYLQHFAPDDAVFVQLAHSARHFFADARVMQSLSETEAFGLQRLIEQLGLLDPQQGPAQVAADILALAPETPLTQWQAQHALTDGFWLNPFARQAFSEALTAPEHVRSSLPYIQRMCEWALHAPGTPQQRFRYPICRDEFAYSLLSPWFQRTPPPEVQHTLMSALLRTLGDPRHDHAGWLGVRQEAMATVSRWLTARTLDAFFEILQHTEDDIGPYRRRFWEAYFHAGHILEAWVALGEEASDALRAIDPTGALAHGKILGKIAPKQCVLMVRMGPLLLCDWSHDGRLRAIDAHSRQAPKLYQAQYELHELRFATNLNFNQGLSDDPGLRHLQSHLGGWQTLARDFLAQHLGITLPLDVLMPSEPL